MVVSTAHDNGIFGASSENRYRPTDFRLLAPRHAVAAIPGRASTTTADGSM